MSVRRPLPAHRALPPGWATDLAILQMTGSSVHDRGDHLVVRTAANPAYRWGNLVLVTDPAAVGDADRWRAAFEESFPAADWVSIGLVRAPRDPSPWHQAGLALETDDVLSAAAAPRRTPPPDGYAVRPFREDDWDRSVARAVAGNDRTGQEEPGVFERFARAQANAWRSLADRGLAVFVGAFRGGALVAELGVVRCGRAARYQHVGTDEEHRRRGLATHLLGEAGAWAAGRGCHRWVIVTEATNPAGRVYRAAGFGEDVGSTRAFLPPGA